VESPAHIFARTTRTTRTTTGLTVTGHMRGTPFPHLMPEDESGVDWCTLYDITPERVVEGLQPRCYIPPRLTVHPAVGLGSGRRERCAHGAGHITKQYPAEREWQHDIMDHSSSGLPGLGHGAWRPAPGGSRGPGGNSRTRSGSVHGKAVQHLTVNGAASPANIAG
jgi:hypothetical protein